MDLTDIRSNISSVILNNSREFEQVYIPEVNISVYTRKYRTNSSYFDVFISNTGVHVQCRTPGHNVVDFRINMLRFEFLFDFVTSLVSIDTLPNFNFDLPTTMTTIDFYGSEFLTFILYFGSEIIQFARNTDGYINNIAFLRL